MSKAEDFISENKDKTDLIETLKKEHLFLIKTKNMNQSYILSSNNKYVITVKNPDSRSIYRQYYKYLSFAIIAILLAFGAFLWLYLFKKELKILNHAAKSLGNGELDTRIQLSKNSSLFPISDSFNDMASRIQSLLNGHRDLTNAVSHEFKTPLSRLHFAVEMQETSKTEEERHFYTSKVKQNIASLEELV
jgi:signal transduction histidine kinase